MKNLREEEESTRVIFAEDDDDDFYLFEKAVEEMTIKVLLRRAENGDILLQLLHSEKTDMLFLDIEMPCKDGRQCLTEIRANKRFDHLPIIIYSSVQRLSDIEFCYRAGSSFYVLKPNTFSEIKTVLERIFSIDWRKMSYSPPFSQFVVNPQ